VPELKSKVPELEQGARTGARSQNWSTEPELEQGVRTGAGRQNWSQVILGVEAGLQETAILPTS